MNPRPPVQPRASSPCDETHRAETRHQSFVTVIVRVEHDLHTVLARERDWAGFDLHPIKNPVVVLIVRKKVMDRTPPHVMEKHELPRLRRGRQIMLEKLVL